MAKKKETTELPVEPAKEAASEGALVKAAKTIGTAAGKIASAVGAVEPAKPAKKKTAKLPKKDKHRLPRRQKKAAAKKAAKQA